MPDKNIESLEIIKESTFSLLPDSKILLFGSRAKNTYSEDSDFDFMIITKNNLDILEKNYIKSVLRKKLARQKISADILIQSEDEIKSKKKVNGHIVRVILKEGILI
ncbi:MAG: nucleotidyltransferase domain-containing protein [Prolixibacteraceae bacterium]|nr:nucleotidyltransferase domain-containing protein [Prolixibacteraceae bacterium]